MKAIHQNIIRNNFAKKFFSLLVITFFFLIYYLHFKKKITLEGKKNIVQFIHIIVFEWIFFFIYLNSSFKDIITIFYFSFGK